MGLVFFTGPFFSFIYPAMSKNVWTPEHKQGDPFQYPTHPERLDGTDQIADFLGLSERQIQIRSTLLQSQGVFHNRWVKNQYKRWFKIVYAYKYTLREYVARLEIAKNIEGNKFKKVLGDNRALQETTGHKEYKEEMKLKK